MKARRLILLSISAALAGHVALLRAQSATVAIRRVGVLVPSTRAKEEVILEPFFNEMRRLGWVEGQNIAYDWVYADDQDELLPRLAAELVARKPDVIYAPPRSSAVAAKRVTQTIPIIFAVVTDPLGTGLVRSFARPGANVTGLSNLADSLAPKRVQLLREILPGAKRLGLLGDPTDPSTKFDQKALAPVGSALGLTIVVAGTSNPVDFDAAVIKLVGERVDAIFTAASTLTFSLRGRLIELANRKHLPVIGHRPQMADDGALFAYGPSQAGQIRRSAYLVDKVLKGAKPADIPVEQPTEFELVVNMKTAKALGITIPPSILLRADRVIE